MVRLFDHDTQGSSLAWIKRRSEDVAEIIGVDASRSADHRLTRSWQLRVPPETDVAIIDSPAGTDITELVTLFQQNDSVLIPVLPSPIGDQSIPAGETIPGIYHEQDFIGFFDCQSRLPRH